MEYIKNVQGAQAAHVYANKNVFEQPVLLAIAGDDEMLQMMYEAAV